ncbi:hypothetical protein D3C80_1312460 [compost metagenome]
MALGLGHERAAVGDFSEGVDIGLFKQHFGHVEVVQLGAAHFQVGVEDQAVDEHGVADEHHAAQIQQVQAGYLEGVKIDPGDHQRGEKRPAPHRQYRHAVQHAGGAQHQPGRAQFLRQAFDHQAHGQGDDADEYQVEEVEVPGLAGERQDDAEGRHDRDEGHRLPGEVLLAQVADDQVEQ